MTTSRTQITAFLDDILHSTPIKDGTYNGLQFEGTPDVKKIGLAVDACLKTYENAVKEKCQMVICHHGFIWGGLDRIHGSIKTQIEYLIKHNLNVYTSHLPLDAHHQFGNNIQLANALKLKFVEPFGDYHGTTIGFQGELPSKMSIEKVSSAFQTFCGGTPTILPFGKKDIESIGIVSGGGSKAIPEAVEKNLDCFITGESFHSDHHFALESKMNVIYLGHYHSEKCGVKAIGKEIEKKFKIETTFLDEPTLFG
jgi:dinuclear metal center YbgI/SA1388 family protein